MLGLNQYRMLDRRSRAVVLATFLGWTLDAFDFFLLIFVIPEIATEFTTEPSSVGFAVTLTLAMRPAWRLRVWAIGRYIRAPADFDAEHPDVFGIRTGLGLFAKPDGAADIAGAVRVCHGRGMGDRHLAGDGNRAARQPRRGVGPAAGRVCGGISAGGAGLWRAVRKPSAGAACLPSACCRRCWSCIYASPWKNRRSGKRSKPRAARSAAI